MLTVQRRKRSGKLTPLFEWQTCGSDAEWQNPLQITRSAIVVHQEVKSRKSWMVRHWRLGIALLTILAISAGWTWDIARQGQAQIEADLQDRVKMDLWLAAHDSQKIYKGSTFAQNGTVPTLTSTVHLVKHVDETSIVRLVTQSGKEQPVLDSIRFYRQTAEGWFPTTPTVELWGAPRSLESSHFSFHFRQNDLQAVTAVTPLMDDIYAELQRELGLTPNAEMLIVEVPIEQVTGATPIQRWPHEPLTVPSPPLYVAPTELGDRELLAQSIALPLIEYMGERAAQEHNIPEHWQPLLLGLRLWQLWDLDMPLAQWRQEIVRSHAMDIPIERAGRQEVRIGRHSELCAMHKLWMLTPMMVGIPIKCFSSHEGTGVVGRLLARAPPLHLNQRTTPLKAKDELYAESNYYLGPPDVVTIATLLEYVKSTYGVAYLPILLTGLSQYND